ncbi:MAG: hypothetical protein KJ896_04440 [Nanoarchaeota archaeon]|nr:hypothetical protein [Nanoarchaeota archaeon]
MKIYKFLFFILVSISLLFTISCTAIQEPTQTLDQPTGTLKGVSLSPKSYSETDFTEFFETAQQTGDVILWAGDWNELEEGAPKVVAELATVYDYTPIIEVGHYIQSSGELIRPFSEENKQIYMDSTIEFVKKYHPEYFGIGVEINIFAEKNPEAFDEFVIFYNEVYGEVKEVSPDTKVFTVFQLENMKGLTMWELEEAKPHWEMIDLFKSDLVAFTTYPGLFYRDVSDIPEDHYTEIQLHTTKPIAFTEMGWHSAASPLGWESSEEEQAEFISTFFQFTENLELELVIWSFMYSPDIFEPFDSMGLIKTDGTTKLSWDAWLEGGENE